MNNKFEYITKNGLKVLYIKKEQFARSYCGIGTSFGGGNLVFKVNGKEYISPSGVAHFIEHKLFAMPDGSDAFDTFNKLNAVSNAYTASDKTLYFFSTTDEIFEPLKLLLNMYFTPYFKEEDIEKEKDIIISELNMYDDKPIARLQKKVLNGLYPNDPYSTPVGGTIDSVSKTTVNDLLLAYNTFYNPDNSYLVIVSKYDENLIFNFIEEVLSQFNFKKSNFEKLPTVKSNDIGENIEYSDEINQNQAVVGIRFNANTDNKLFCNFIIGIFDCLFSPMADFYNELYEDRLFIADIDYSVVTEKYSAYAIISTTSNKPKEFIEKVINKLKNLKINDLDEEIIDLYLRHLKAKSISLEDSIESLGDEILSLALEGDSYFDEQESILKLKVEDFYSIISLINDAKYLEIVCKKIEK